METPQPTQVAVASSNEVGQISNAIDQLRDTALSVHQRTHRTRTILLGTISPSPASETATDRPDGLLYQIRADLEDICSTLLEALKYQEEVLTSLAD